MIIFCLFFLVRGCFFRGAKLELIEYPPSIASVRGPNRKSKVASTFLFHSVDFGQRTFPPNLRGNRYFCFLWKAVDGRATGAYSPPSARPGLSLTRE